MQFVYVQALSLAQAITVTGNRRTFMQSTDATWPHNCINQLLFNLLHPCTTRVL